MIFSSVAFQIILKSIMPSVAYGIKAGPLRLINNRNILHLERCGLPVRANDKVPFGNWNDPIQPRRRNWRMKIVNLILRSSLPLK